MEESRSYVLITPCKNEAENLPNLIESISAQTIKPILHIIVNDGSGDDTPNIINSAINKYEWIKSINLDKYDTYLGAHYAVVCNKGFYFAKEYCQKNKLFYEYIGIVDADNILEKEYFEKLIFEFEKDPKLGLASGESAYGDIKKILAKLKEKDNNIDVMSPIFWELYGSTELVIQGSYRTDIPMGSARMWRKKCFDESGKYLEVHAPDAVSNIKAKLRGWKTLRFPNARVIERERSTAQGYWKGYEIHGEADFFVGYSLSIATLKAFGFLINRAPFYTGIAYFWGHIKSHISGKKPINDLEIRYYYKFVRPSELKQYYKNKIIKILKSIYIYNLVK